MDVAPREQLDRVDLPGNWQAPPRPIPSARACVHSSAETKDAPLAMAAPTALATPKNGGRMISFTPSSSSGAMMLPPPTSKTVMSSGDVFILRGNEHQSGATAK